MNKTYTFIRLAVALLAGSMGLVVTGCQPEGLQPQTGRLQLKQLTIQGTYELPESDTKTVLHSDGHVYWVPGDAICLFYGSGTDGGSKFSAIATEGSSVTNFTGSIVRTITGLSTSVVTLWHSAFLLLPSAIPTMFAFRRITTLS